MSGGRLRVAAVQHDIVWADREANFERLAPQVAAAAGTAAGGCAGVAEGPCFCARTSASIRLRSVRSSAVSATAARRWARS